MITGRFYSNDKKGLHVEYIKPTKNNDFQKQDWLDTLREIRDTGDTYTIELYENQYEYVIYKSEIKAYDIYEVTE